MIAQEKVFWKKQLTKFYALKSIAFVITLVSLSLVISLPVALASSERNSTLLLWLISAPFSWPITQLVINPLIQNGFYHKYFAKLSAHWKATYEVLYAANIINATTKLRHDPFRPYKYLSISDLQALIDVLDIVSDDKALVAVKCALKTPVIDKDIAALAITNKYLPQLTKLRTSKYLLTWLIFYAALAAIGVIAIVLTVPQPEAKKGGWLLLAAPLLLLFHYNRRELVIGRKLLSELARELNFDVPRLKPSLSKMQAQTGLHKTILTLINIFYFPTPSHSIITAVDNYDAIDQGFGKAAHNLRYLIYLAGRHGALELIEHIKHFGLPYHDKLWEIKNYGKPNPT